MSANRQLNLLGQWRLDVPHLRSIESSVAADFDLLAGQVIGGGEAYVVRGFEIAMASALNNPATSLQLIVANSALIHPLASENGSIFSVDAAAAIETLSVTNTKIVGGFTANATNFVGIDLRRLADDSTSDVVMFIDATTRVQTPKTVPLARTLDFRIVISTTDFAATPHVCPIAKVTTNSSNLVTAVEDCRQMLFRLGRGGSNPDRSYAFPWLGNRSEGTSGTTVFDGGDKELVSLKDLLDALMTRCWELGGGQYWYSATSDRDIKLAKGPTVIGATGDNFQWTLGSGTLEWTDLALVFANTTGWFNDIADGSIAGIADGECVYVDVDRSSNRTGGTALTMQKASLTTLGSPIVPGSRFVIAWRLGNDIFIRDRDYQVGRIINVATNLVQGTVKLSYAAGTPADPVVAPLDANGRISATATGGNSEALFGTGNGSGAGVKGQGGATGVGGHFTGGATSGHGVTAIAGGGASYGVLGTSNTTGPTSYGVVGIGLGIGGSAAGAAVFGLGNFFNEASNATIGVLGQGGGANPGIKGIGGTTGNGFGGDFIGGGTIGGGLRATAQGTGSGVLGIGGSSSGSGVMGLGGAANGIGVEGIADGTGSGVKGTGGDAAGIGVEGIGGSNGASIGVKGTGGGAGTGVVAIAGASGRAVEATGGTLGGERISITGSVAGVNIAANALQLRNTGTANGTVVALGLIHAALDGNDDGILMWTERMAEDSVELVLGHVTDGSLLAGTGSMMRFSTTGITPTTDQGPGIGLPTNRWSAAHVMRYQPYSVTTAPSTQGQLASLHQMNLCLAQVVFPLVTSGNPAISGTRHYNVVGVTRSAAGRYIVELDQACDPNSSIMVSLNVKFTRDPGDPIAINRRAFARWGDDPADPTPNTNFITVFVADSTPALVDDTNYELHLTVHGSPSVLQ
jgi:hypothetical protein